MAILRVNPTRMELTKLKKRLKTAARGHKLLKDKRDEMVRQFMLLIRKNRTMRIEVEKALSSALADFVLARVAMTRESMDEALLFPLREVDLEVSKTNIMSVNVPKIDYQEKKRTQEFFPYGMLSTSAELDSASAELSKVLPTMVELAELEKTCNMLADEIEKTRRRVNALEYVMIPQLEETIKYIKMKLDENERGSLTRLMKTKDMIQQREAAQ
ncbi:MAG: V-type ATP synthase subunit D [Clostridia bacterium]|jgi:V/A-type H+/Na+-transporting ATPase subunit D|nr:V-type ATP synthase subunit D [Clostridia bacterium]MBT7122681.1 V-type ATP synthase subunit D [Clostridia bacterium]